MVSQKTILSAALKISRLDAIKKMKAGDMPPEDWEALCDELPKFLEKEFVKVDRIDKILFSHPIQRAFIAGARWVYKHKLNEQT